MPRNPNLDPNLISMYLGQAQALLLNFSRSSNELTNQFPGSPTQFPSVTSQSLLTRMKRCAHSMQCVVHDLHTCLTDSLELERINRTVKSDKE